jgi:serine/threonine protein kinase
MNCEKCKTPLPEDGDFCPNCAHRRGAAVPAAAAPPDRKVEAPGLQTFSGLGTIAPMVVHQVAALEPGSLFAERYEIVRKIGAGGMGVVYLASDSHTGVEVVLKLIHPDVVQGEDAVKRLIAEGLTARQIRHPNIVAVYDVAQHAGQPYFTMEYVGGGTLRSWMANHMASGQDVSLGTAAGIIKPMLAGISEAHRMRIVHRDLKPENVLLAGNPDEGNFDLKILDFGIAKALKGTGATTAAGRPMGTPVYMAPEQMTAADSVGPAADIYSLAVIFYELLMEATPQARFEAVSKSRPEIPAPIDALIEKALSARPRSRYASAAEFEAALDAALASGARPSPPPIVPDLPPPSPVTPPSPAPKPLDPDPVPPHGGDRRPPSPPLPPQPPPRPPDPPPLPVTHSGWAGLSSKVKMAVYAGAAFLVLGVIGYINQEPPVPPQDADFDGVYASADFCPALAGPASNDGCPVDDPDPEPEPEPDPGPVPPPPPPPPPPPNVQRWRDDSGNVYTVTRSGMGFDGVADNVRVNGIPYGRVSIAGVVSPAGGNIVMTNQTGVVFQSPIGAAVPGTDPRTTDTLFGTMRFHVDH